jgi:uncharacterized membrane protein YqjE
MESNTEKETTYFESLLNLLALISILSFFITIILKIWINEDYQWILNRILLTSIVLLIGSVSVYGLWFYESNKAE